MTGDTADPTRIRSIAVHREDVANALEATLRTDREVVLRVTPPFSGRMRARLHAADASDGAETGPPTADSDEASTAESDAPTAESDASTADPGAIHIDPRELVEGVPTYPEVDETAAAHPDADVETRRRRHGEAVEAWRERVRESITDAIVLDIDEGNGGDVDERDGGEAERDRDGPDHEVSVVALG